MEAEAVSIKHALAGKRARENGTHDRDTVAADARVALEDDVTALVDGKAVILNIPKILFNQGFPVENTTACELGCERNWIEPQ